MRIADSDSRPTPSRGERHVLLASSGELPWRQHVLLPIRLALDPAARRLARDLELVEIGIGQPRASRSLRPGWPTTLAAAAVLALATVAAWILVPRAAPNPAETVVRSTPEPAIAAARSLHLASLRAGEAPLSGLTPRPLPSTAIEPAPILPPWSRATAIGMEGRLR